MKFAVPMLDMDAHQRPFADALKTALAQVVDSGRYIGGARIAELEQRIASYVGASHAIGVSSGTDALLASLMALGIGPGDQVLTTPYSFFATAGSIARVGARPVFVDIDPLTGNIDAPSVQTVLDAFGADIRAILPVHLFGQTAHMQPLLEAASDHGIPVIEDAAQAIGARAELASGTARAGSMGALGCLSFFPSKNLGGIGDGGMVLTSDADLADRVRSLRSHGADANQTHALLGGNFRLDALQAAALLVKLPYLDGWHQARRAHAMRYDAALASVDDVTPLGLSGPRDAHCYNQYVIRVPGRRDALMQHLQDHGIASAVYYRLPLHLQPCFAHLEYSPGDFPHAEALAADSMAIPVYAELTDQQQQHVIETIRAF